MSDETAAPAPRRKRRSPAPRPEVAPEAKVEAAPVLEESTPDLGEMPQDDIAAAATIDDTPEPVAETAAADDQAPLGMRDSPENGTVPDEEMLEAIPEPVAEAAASLDEAQTALFADVTEQVESVAEVAARQIDQMSDAALAGAVQAEEVVSRLNEQVTAQMTAAQEALEAQMQKLLAAAEVTLTRLVDQVETQQAAAAQTRQQVMAFQKERLEGAGAAGSAVIGGLAEARQRVSDFAAARIRQDIEAHGEMLGCRSFTEVREVQSRFFRSALDQYAAETTQMMKLGSELLSAAIPRRH